MFDDCFVEGLFWKFVCVEVFGCFCECVGYVWEVFCGVDVVGEVFWWFDVVCDVVYVGGEYGGEGEVGVVVCVGDVVFDL